MLYYISIGLGKHFDTIPPQDQVRGLEALFAVYFTYVIGISLAKTSALFFYSRVFTTHDPRFRWALWITQGLQLTYVCAEGFPPPPPFILFSLFSFVFCDCLEFTLSIYLHSSLLSRQFCSVLSVYSYSGICMHLKCETRLKLFTTRLRTLRDEGN